MNSLQNIQLLLIDFNRVDDVLKNPLDKNLIQEEKNEEHVSLKAATAKREGFLEVHDVTYGFNTLAEPILKNISLKVSPGKAIAIVGPSGTGKSTLLKLIAGLYYPWSGEILFDGTPRSKLPHSSLTNSLGYVEQEYFLFSGTVKENLTCFDSLVDPNDLIQAAKDACIHDDIVSRHNGYDMKLENDGANLSGGQRQQLEIARALIKKPTILILDEATSFIDSDKELEIFKNIRRRGLALIIVTHRLSTIQSCDLIYVMESGIIADVGTHADLMMGEGLYRKLNELSRVEEAELE